MLANIELVTGELRDRFLTWISATSVDCVTFIALRDAFIRMLKDTLRLICSIVRGVVFVLQSVPKRS